MNLTEEGWRRLRAKGPFDFRLALSDELRNKVSSGGLERLALRATASTVESRPVADARTDDAPADSSLQDDPLWQQLRALRQEWARETKVPPYIIFPTRSSMSSCGHDRELPRPWERSRGSARHGSNATAPSCSPRSPTTLARPRGSEPSALLPHTEGEARPEGRSGDNLPESEQAGVAGAESRCARQPQTGAPLTPPQPPSLDTRDKSGSDFRPVPSPPLGPTSPPRSGLGGSSTAGSRSTRPPRPGGSCRPTSSATPPWRSARGSRSPPSRSSSPELLRRLGCLAGRARRRHATAHGGGAGRPLEPVRRLPQPGGLDILKWRMGHAA